MKTSKLDLRTVTKTTNEFGTIYLGGTTYTDKIIEIILKSPSDLKYVAYRYAQCYIRVYDTTAHDSAKNMQVSLLVMTYGYYS